MLALLTKTPAMTVSVDNGRVTIKDGSSSVEILKYGANVLSWIVDGKEQLWLSKGSKLDGSKAVRGGIPLVFPRFGPPNEAHAATKDLPQHGFARSVEWEFLGQTDDNSVQFGLGPEMLPPQFTKAWSYNFTLVYTVKLAADTLNVSLDVENAGDEPFDFNVLFHTYFRVPEVEDVAVDGLHGLSYWNKVVAEQVPAEKDPQVTFSGEVDRVYDNTPKDISIQYKGKKIFTITANNTLDTVVWNPWTETAKGMSDFEPKDGFHQMVCVENGSVKDFVKLAAGKSWSAGITIKALL